MKTHGKLFAAIAAGVVAIGATVAIASTASGESPQSRNEAPEPTGVVNPMPPPPNPPPGEEFR